MRRFAAALILVAGVAGCSPLTALNATVPPDGVTVLRDVAYGDDPRQTMDVYEPPSGAGERPMVVFFYGGSWKSGDRAEYAFIGRTLAKLGYVVAVPDYRLYPQVRFPGFMADGASAAAFAARHAGEYGADPHPFVMGHSAGAYIALLLALDPEYLSQAGLDRGALRGAIGLAGPYDFHPPEYPDVAPIFDGFDDGRTQPVRFADRGAPPLLLLAGDADMTVRPYNTAHLADAERAAGGEVRSVFYPGVGHTGLLLALTPLFKGNAPALDDVTSFLTKYRGRTLAGLTLKP